jgi:tetraacyldisaccharide 4'-kinase
VLQANLPGVPHFQGRDRVALGREAIREGGQVLILDDGFQHVRLHRDLDFVLIDAIVPFGFGRVLPAGLLREPLDALSCAHLLGITRADQVEPKTLSTLSAYLRNRFPGIPQVQLVTRAIEWTALSGEREPPDALRDRTALAFCGIGNPEAFRRQVLSLGVKLRGFVGFRDHHGYTEPDIQGLAARAKDLGAEQVIMTQKDAVKISSPLAASWKYLRIEARIARGEDGYRAALARSIGKSAEHAR